MFHCSQMTAINTTREWWCTTMLQQEGARVTGQGNFITPRLWDLVPSLNNNKLRRHYDADLRMSIRTWMRGTWNTSLLTIPAMTITEKRKLTYATAIAILEIHGNKLNMSHKGQYPLWRRKLEARNKVTWRRVSQPSEFEKGKVTKDLPRVYNKLSIARY